MDLTIREIKIEDSLSYKSLRLQALGSEPSFTDNLEVRLKMSDLDWQKQVERFISSEYLKMIVAEADGKIVGTVLVEYNGLPKLKHVAELGNVYVAPEFRKLGIGRRLLEKALEEIKSNSIEKVMLEVADSQIDAQNLYKSFGFIEVGRRGKHIKLDGKYLDELIMECFL